MKRTGDSNPAHEKPSLLRELSKVQLNDQLISCHLLLGLTQVVRAQYSKIPLERKNLHFQGRRGAISADLEHLAASTNSYTNGVHQMMPPVYAAIQSKQ